MGRALQTYKTLFGNLKKKGPASMYLLYGPEEFIKKEFVSELLKSALPESNRAFNLDIFHGDDFDCDAFDSRVSSFPLFAERRMVIVKRFEALSTQNKDFVLERIQDLPASMVFVIETSAEKMDTVRMKNLKKLVDSRGVAVAFELLSDDESVSRIKNRLRLADLGIEPEALDLLVGSVGTSLMDLVNEVDKIILSAGDEKVVTRKTVSEVVGKYRTENLFALIDHLGQTAPASLLSRVNRLLDGGEEPIFVLAMLLRRIVILLAINALTRGNPRARSPRVIASALAGFVSPYFAGRLLDQAARFDREELETYLGNLRWADRMLKSTPLSSRSVLETALLAASTGKRLAPPAVW